MAKQWLNEGCTKAKQRPNKGQTKAKQTADHVKKSKNKAPGRLTGNYRDDNVSFADLQTPHPPQVSHNLFDFTR